MRNCANMEALKIQRGVQLKLRLSWLTLMLIVLTITLRVEGNIARLCPNQCDCGFVTDKNRTKVLRVQCFDGGMNRIPTDVLDASVSILEIAAPTDYPNHLTVGPIFTQPRAFVKLKEVSIVNSNVPSIGHHSFWGLANLTKLNLTHNNIAGVGKENFKGLLNLADLYLDHNQIGDMPSETFVYCPSLDTLSLSYNRISSLMPRVFRNLGKLRVLNLSHNRIQELNPEIFQDIQSLKVFICRRCMLSRINQQIYHLVPLLEEIDISDNLFKYLLSDEYTNLKKLRKIILDGNQLSVIVDNVFGQNHLLETVSVARNRLAILAPKAFTNLTQLIHLDISHNKLDRLDLQTFNPVSGSTKTINFSGNKSPINEIALILQIIPEVHVVGLANLSLSDLPQNFLRYNNNLRRLDLSHNKLQKFPLTLISNKKFLQFLDISHNELTLLLESDLRRLEGISQVIISNNQWHCYECTAKAMMKYMDRTTLNEALQEVKCYLPIRLRGTKLCHLTIDLLDVCMVSKETQINVAAGLVVVLVGALGTMMTAIYCSRRRADHYYTNEGKICEHDHDHPEELLPPAELNAAAVATIHAPYNASNRR